MYSTEKDEQKGSRKLQELINSGTEIAGGAVGGALGFLAGGPIGAALLGAAGSAAAKALQYIGNEVSERLLAPREKVRVGGLLALAADEIRKRIEAGEQIRQDGFFEADASAIRTNADEVVEGILLKCQREPEEKKIPYMGHLLANVTFDQSISHEMVHQIIKAAEQLTYRQLCLLKIAVIKDFVGLRSSDYRGQGSFPKELYQVLYECLDLYNRGFINFAGEVALGLTDIAPGKMSIQGLGADAFNLMGLIAIPETDLLPIINQLK